MGHNHVRALLLAQPPVDLPPAAFRVLLLMASCTLDKDNPPQYWAGVSFLTLNMPPLAPGSGRRVMMRHIATLQDAGYVFRTDKRVGQRRVYELRIPGLSAASQRSARPVDNPPWRGG